MSGAEWAERVATRYGPISDDLERSCRIYHAGGEGCLGLFHELVVEKKQPPAVWQLAKGGIASLFPSPSEFIKERKATSMGSPQSSLRSAGFALTRLRTKSSRQDGSGTGRSADGDMLAGVKQNGPHSVQRC